MKTFDFQTDRAHRTITADAHVPNLCGIRVDLAPADNPAAPAMTNQLLVAITPASRTSCYEFTAVAQTFPFANANREEDMRNLLMEDVNAMEDIQRLFDRLGAAHCDEVSVSSDRSAMRMRRIVAQMLAGEGSFQAGSQSARNTSPSRRSGGLERDVRRGGCARRRARRSNTRVVASDMYVNTMRCRYPRARSVRPLRSS